MSAGGESVRLMRVLVADDDPEWVRIVSAALPNAGVTHAHSAHGALAVLADETPFDLVLVDVRMPGSTRDAFEAAVESGAVVRLVSGSGGVCGWSSANLHPKSVEALADAVEEVFRCES